MHTGFETKVCYVLARSSTCATSSGMAGRYSSPLTRDDDDDDDELPLGGTMLPAEVEGGWRV